MDLPRWFWYTIRGVIVTLCYFSDLRQVVFPEKAFNRRPIRLGKYNQLFVFG
jgi:hypothetical protein